MKRLLLYLLSVIIPVSSVGQNPDSLLRYSQDVALLEEVALQMVEARNIPEAIKFYKHIGSICRESDDFMLAIHYHEKGLELATQSADTVEIIQCLNQIGTNYRRMSVLEDASNFHYRALTLCEQYSDKTSENALRNKVFSLNGIGNVYLTLNNFAVADSLFRAALAGEIALGNHLGMAINYANIGALYEGRQMYDSARVYYERSMENNRLANSNLGISLCHIHFGRLAEIDGDFDEALKHYQEAYLMGLSGDRWHWLEACIAIVRVYIIKQDMRSASIYLDRAEEAAHKIQSKESFALVYKTKYLFYEKSGDNGKALENYILSRNYEDSILNVTNVTHVSNLRLRYETELRETMIEIQAIQIRQKQTERNILLSFGIFSVLILALVLNMLRLRNRRNRALTEMNATKDKFFNIISHDLKNPALAQRDALQMLVANSHLWETEMLADFTNELLKSAERHVELLNSLLNWARIQTGRIACKPALFDLAARLRTDIALIRKMAENKHINLVLNLPDTAPVMGDANMLVTVVRNLLTNAVKFTAPNGTVTLDVTAISPNHYTITVNDTGTGMTPIQLENFFHLDKQQTCRGTAGEEGSGLGLIVCKELLSMHNSLLHVESEAGKGSKFWFTI